MAKEKRRKTPPPYGRVDVGERRPYETAGPGATIVLHTWRPARSFARNLPGGFSISVNAITAEDGLRRFVPEDVGALILNSSLGGAALLAKRGLLDAERGFSYKAMRFHYLMSGRFREHFDREFHRKEDLLIPRHAAAVAEERHVLPNHVGLDGQGRGKAWSPATLIAEGRAANGSRKAGVADFIRLGLTEAARRNPLKPEDLTLENCSAIVRMALFDCKSDGSIAGEERRRLVQHHFLEDMEKREKKPDGRFWTWLHGDLSSIVHAIAKRKGIGLQRDEIRAELLRLGFDSYRYMSDCLNAQMEDFAAALPQPLTASERTHFSALYANQHHWGGLSFLLLRDRFSFLKEAVFGHLEVPDDPVPKGVLLRLLQYYGEMAASRRRSDATAKAVAGVRNTAGKPARNFEFDENRDEDGQGRVDRVAVDRMQAIAVKLREQRRAACECGTTALWYLEYDDADPEPGRFRFRDICGRCAHQEDVVVTREQALRAEAAIR